MVSELLLCLALGHGFEMVQCVQSSNVKGIHYPIEL